MKLSTILRVLGIVKEKQGNVIKQRKSQRGIAVGDDIHASYWQKLEHLRGNAAQRVSKSGRGSEVSRKEAGNARRRIRQHGKLG